MSRFTRLRFLFGARPAAPQEMTEAQYLEFRERQRRAWDQLALEGRPPPRFERTRRAPWWRAAWNLLLSLVRP